MNANVDIFGEKTGDTRILDDSLKRYNLSKPNGGHVFSPLSFRSSDNHKNGLNFNLKQSFFALKE